MERTELIHTGLKPFSPCLRPELRPSDPSVTLCSPAQKHNYPQGTLSDRRIRHTTDLDRTSPRSLRESVGGKGMFLLQMQRADLSVPEFQCVTTDLVKAIEQYSLDSHRLSPYIPGIADELSQKTSLMDIKAHIIALPAVNRDKRAEWLAGLSQFIASNDFYELVNDSEAARQIRRLKMPLSPVIVRSSGINEDNYGDARAGKYLSEVQGDEDVLRTCLKVMASGYRPDLCTSLQPMALIVQRCIDCRFGGVAMSYQSLQDDTIRVEYTPGQPRGAVAGLSDTRVHRIDIGRGNEQPQFTQGQVSRCFILQKSDGGYIEVETSSLPGDGERQRLSDGLVAKLRQNVTTLEDLLLCPVDVEFAIDHEDRLFLLQVRPITRLCGGMAFAMAMPGATLATGEGVSEGYCTGALWPARNQRVDTMPEGAIVVARHGEAWMLVPEYLSRAAGFVFATGGCNDHVAITLRQAGKPCLLVGEHYQGVTTHQGQQTTLVCARFNGTPQAFIVGGDFSAQLIQHRVATSASEAVKVPKVQASRDDLLPPEGTFDRIDTAFRWLTEQNARLLAFFASGAGLDCLSSPITLSMSVQRSQIVAAACTCINQLVQGTEALLYGYQAYLPPDVDEPLIKPMLDELPELITRFGVLKQTITSRLDTISSYLAAPPESPRRFQEWMATCQQLQSCLQELHPREAYLVRSVHDLIFILHQRFVDALRVVVLVSGQGKLTRNGDITCVDYFLPGEEGLLRASTKASIQRMWKESTLVNMADALFVCLSLGQHIAVIELLEQAEGGKGRTLRLRFTEKFHSPDGSDAPGKLKRMWFLFQLVRATGVNKDAADMKVRINAVAGAMTIECCQMASRQTMQDAFDILTALLNELDNFDCYIKDKPLFAGDQWDFNTLARRLDSDGSTPANRFAFNQCLFSTAFRYCYSQSRYYRFLSNHHQQLIDHAQQLGTFSGTHQEMLMLMGDKVDQNSRRELMHHLLFWNAGTATLLIEQEYNLQNKLFVLNPSPGYRLEFHIHPDHPILSDRETFNRTMRKYDVKFASQLIRNDKEAVLPLIKEQGLDLKWLSTKLKSDKEVVMAAVCNFGFSLRYASPELQDDDEVVMAAITEQPKALCYASERIRSNKNVVQMVIRDDITGLSSASETLLNDCEYMLSIIKRNARAFNFCGKKLRDDESFREAAIRCNCVVKEILSHL